MPPKLRGKWALGITPRNLTWVIKDKLAICERPGGFGTNHRRVRRQEEIIWLRENDFDYVVSILAAPHNLHNYDELGMPYRHHPLLNVDDMDAWLKNFYLDLNSLLRENKKLIVHAEEVEHADATLDAIGLRHHVHATGEGAHERSELAVCDGLTRANERLSRRPRAATPASRHRRR